jgi:integrase
MAIEKLSPAALNRKKPGMYADGGGLWLQISIAKDGVGRNRSWIFRWSIADATRKSGYRTREMGLGSLDTVGLTKARELALWCRQLRLDGKDPIVERAAERAARAAATAKVRTFDQCMHEYLAAHRAKWRSEKHSQQWIVSMRKHASPVLGNLPVQQIDIALVRKALERIWHKTPESGSRLRARVEDVLDYAKASGYRHGDNPAKWSGLLENLLPSRRELQPVVHHAALAYQEMPAFMAGLRERESTVARALEFLVLVAGRRGEVIGARWDEIDIAAKTWTIPAERMKSGKEHIVPLSARCLAILEDMERVRQNVFIFPGRDGRMWGTNFDHLMKTLGHGEVTIHGMRATFRTWAAERTNFPHEVADLCLSHAVSDEVVKAYKRTTLFDRRRKLMAAWSDYCANPAPPLRQSGATVTPIRQVGA